MSSDNRPVCLLDVDGVINTSRPGWGGAPRKTRIDRLTIRWAPKMVTRIYNLHHAGTIEARWCSTWCGYPDELAILGRILGLDLAAAFGDRPASKTWGDLKVEAALGVLAAGRRLVWADDEEVAAARILFPEVAAAEADGRALLLAPRSTRGLQPEDLDAVEVFAAAPMAAQ